MKKSFVLYLLIPLLLFSCKQGNKPAVVADQKTSVHPEWVYNATIYEKGRWEVIIPSAIIRK
jgi:hypothetical protein